MPHTEIHDAIVLKTYDVGEADRFCILFTRTRGRLAVRAPAVRRLRSRMGGSLLPFQRATIQLKESRTGFLITSAQTVGEPAPHDVSGFVRREQGIEILLCLLHDEESLQQVFDLTVGFRKDPNVLPFSIRLLHLLGLISVEYFGTLSERERTFVQTCLSERWHKCDLLLEKEMRRLSSLCEEVIVEQGGRSLKVTQTHAILGKKHAYHPAQ